MADHADGGNNDNDVFVYMGGSIPEHLKDTITHVRIHKSVKIITRSAFRECYNLVSIEMHDGVEIIEKEAFFLCTSLRGVKLTGVRVIESGAFSSCTALTDVFGDKLESIGQYAFNHCTSLRSIKLSKVRIIGYYAFHQCEQLTEPELPEDLERIGGRAFFRCFRLTHIAMPLKNNVLGEDVFDACDNLSQVYLVGGIHKTVSSLLIDSWRDEMNDEIDRINQLLPNTATSEKTALIQQWMESVRDRIRHHKSQHYALLKNSMTQLELALWKANLPNVDAARRDEARITCGTNIIIPHVLSFLNDEEVFPTVRDIPL